MEDKRLVALFRGQAKNQRLPLKFRDHSIKEPIESGWKEQCEAKIRRSSVTICLVGRMTHLSDAVNWEIRKSVELDKAVMAVYLVDGHPPLPAALQENSTRPVRWKINEIMTGIRRVVE